MGYCGDLTRVRESVPGAEKAEVRQDGNFRKFITLLIWNKFNDGFDVKVVQNLYKAA